MTSLRSKLIRLAYQKPETRKDLLPLLVAVAKHDPSKDGPGGGTVEASKACDKIQQLAEFYFDEQQKPKKKLPPVPKWLVGELKEGVKLFDNLNPEKVSPLQNRDIKSWIPDLKKMSSASNMPKELKTWAKKLLTAAESYLADEAKRKKTAKDDSDGPGGGSSEAAKSLSAINDLWNHCYEESGQPKENLNSPRWLVDKLEDSIKWIRILNPKKVSNWHKGDFKSWLPDLKKLSSASHVPKTLKLLAQKILSSVQKYLNDADKMVQDNKDK